MSRQNFPQSIKVAVIKRATRDGVIYCESCSLPARKFQIDHVIADAHGGKPVIENAELICEPCYSVKNPIDTTIAAKIKRQEANHLGVKPSGPKMQIRPKADKPPPKAPVPGMSNIARRFR